MIVTSTHRRLRLVALLFALLIGSNLSAQNPAPIQPGVPPPPPPGTPPPPGGRPPLPPLNPSPRAPEGAASIEKIGTNQFRLGQVLVDTVKREMTVSGHVNEGIAQLEFIANTPNGMKAYESAFTLDANAVTFNTALILIGLDKAHSKGSRFHFDPERPQGDGVEIWIECPDNRCARMRAEQVMFDKGSGKPAAAGDWVYTGSTVLSDGRYMAELDGVLIGFVHDPASIIEYATGAGLGRYGDIVVNPNVGLSPGTQIKLTVRAVGAPAKP